MKIKYKLIYEWESPSADIESYAQDNDCSIDKAINELIQWNTEEYFGRMEMRAANILDGYTSQFKYEVVDD
jgi:hypothetical protein